MVRRFMLSSLGLIFVVDFPLEIFTVNVFKQLEE